MLNLVALKQSLGFTLSSNVQTENGLVITQTSKNKNIKDSRDDMRPRSKMKKL